MTIRTRDDVPLQYLPGERKFVVGEHTGSAECPVIEVAYHGSSIRITHYGSGTMSFGLTDVEADLLVEVINRARFGPK